MSHLQLFHPGEVPFVVYSAYFFVSEENREPAAYDRWYRQSRKESLDAMRAEGRDAPEE